MSALFDKIAVDLESSGVVAARDDEDLPILTWEGRPFARLVGETMWFLLPTGSPALGDALALDSSRPAGEGAWVEVDASDVSEWPRLAEQALAGVRD